MNRTWLLIVLIGGLLFGGTQSLLAQTISWEQDLNSQYPKGTVLNLLATGVVGTIGCQYHSTSTFKVKDGKLHAPGLADDLMTSTCPNGTQPIAPGTQVSLTGMKVYQKVNKVAFFVLQGQCTVADCSFAIPGFVSAEVDFEFPKGFLETAQLTQVAEAIRRVFSIASSPNVPAQIVEVAAPAPIMPLRLPSIYVNTQTPADKLELKLDNSFTLQEGGQPYHGTFMANGNTLELNINETSTKTTLTRQGNDLADSSGQTWSFQEQSAGTAAPGGAMLHNEDIINLAKAGLDDAIIISKIARSKCQFDTSTDALIQLKKQGVVSAAVLNAMVGTGK